MVRLRVKHRVPRHLENRECEGLTTQAKTIVESLFDFYFARAEERRLCVIEEIAYDERESDTFLYDTLIYTSHYHKDDVFLINF